RAYCLKTQPATGETYPKSDLFNKAYVVEKKITRKVKHGQTQTDYDYKPGSGIVGSETVSQKHYWRRLDVEVGDAANLLI
ncbi:hypothetical protein F9006_23730, partial [Escherichia coli]